MGVLGQRVSHRERCSVAVRVMRDECPDRRAVRRFCCQFEARVRGLRRISRSLSSQEAVSQSNGSVSEDEGSGDVP